MKDKIVYNFKKNSINHFWLCNTIGEAVDQAYTHYNEEYTPVKIMFNDDVMYDKDELNFIFNIRKQAQYIKKINGWNSNN